MLSEPIVQQPLHLSFDARGRLWVVQYIQYPEPAGIRVEGEWLWVDRPDPDRRTMRVAKDAGWELDRQRDSLGLRAGEPLQKPWVLVAGLEDGILVQAP